MNDMPDELRDLWKQTSFDPARYTRRELYKDESVSVLLLGWLPGQASEIHDHGGSACCFRVLRGVAVESRFETDGHGHAVEISRDAFMAGSVLGCDGLDIHSIINDRAAAEPLVTLHVYRPEPVMRFYKAVAGEGAHR